MAAASAAPDDGSMARIDRDRLIRWHDAQAPTGRDGAASIPAPVGRCLALTALFVVLAAIGASHHEMWRDELEIWLIGRDSATFGDLLTNMGTEGHPALWYVIAWLVAKLSHVPAALQLVNVSLSGAAAWLFLRRAPFPFALRAGLIFGYYPLYEFGVIAREYALQWLLALAACALFGERERRPWLLALVLALLANTSLYGAFIAGAIGAVAVAERALRVQPGATGPAPPRRAELLAVAVWIAGVGAAVAHVLVQYRAIGETHLGVYAPDWSPRWLAEALATVAYGFVPLPDPRGTTIWNTSALGLLGSAAPWIGAALGVVLLVAAGLALRRVPLALAAWILGAAPGLGIILFFWYGQSRHHGQVFVVFVLAAWLAAWLDRERGAPPRAALALLTVLAPLHLLAAGALLVADVALPFSHSRDVAGIVSEPPLDEAILVGSWDYAAQPVAAWIDRSIWYAESGRFGTFMRWGANRRPMPPDVVLSESLSLFRRQRRPVVMILDYQVGDYRVGEDVPLADGARMRYLARLDGAMVPDENYSLFLLYDPDAGRWRR